MNIFRQSCHSKAIFRILIYSLVISFCFHSYSSAETPQKNKEEVKHAVMDPGNSNEKSDNKHPAFAKDPSGYEVFIDPKTGKFVEPPTKTPVTREEEEGGHSLETQQEAEPAVEMPAPGGGVMLEQPGGFLQDSTAAIDANGKIMINCSEHSEHDNQNTPDSDGRK
jgi:hypothetical protein